MVEQETGIIFDRDAGEIFQDPDFLRSRLPQPYRMINKVLNDILELTWNKIVPIEEKKERLKSRFKSPECNFSAMIRPFSNVNTISIVEDENGFIVVGLTDGLAISSFKDGCDTNYAYWHEEGTTIEIISVMKCKKHEGCFYIAVSDMEGIIRMFCFSRNILFFICQLNKQESNVKVVDMKLSPCCEYIALTLKQLEEDEKSEQYILELYSLPSGEWMSTMKSHATEIKFEPDPTKYESLKNLKKNVVQEITFSQPKLLMKQVQPISPSAPNRIHMDEILKYLDKPWIPGLGRQTLITQRVINSRWNHLIQSEKQKLNFIESFEKANAFKRTFRSSDYGTCKSGSNKERRHGGGDAKIKMAEWLKLVEKVPPTKPSFHFIASQRTKNLTTRQLMVTWKFQTDVYHYNLEEVKKQPSAQPDPDIFWPTPSDIVASDATRSTMILASRGNNVIIWNGKLGIVKDVFKIEDKGSIMDVIIIDKSFQTDDQSRSIEINTNGSGMCFWVVVLSTSGYIYVLDIAQNARPSKLPINPFIEDYAEVPRSIHKLPGLKDTFAIVQSDRRIFLYNMIENKNVCEIIMPCFVQAEATTVTSFVDGDEQYLLVIGRRQEKDINRNAAEVETKEETSKRPLGGDNSGEAKKSARKTAGEENDRKMAASDSWVSEHSCIFIFKVSDFTSSKKFFFKGEKAFQCVGVSPSTFKEALSANKDILERIQKQDCLNERLVKKWLERKKTFDYTVIS